MIVIRGEVVFNEETIFDKPVTIYPESFVSTSGKGKVILNKTLNVIGNTPVFSDNINMQFGEGCIGTLNVGWFGAKGYDRVDDTKAFQMVLGIAAGMTNTVCIFVPIGKYYVSEQLVVENNAQRNKSINLIGEGMSTSTNDGSSLIWTGTDATSMVLIRNNYLNQIRSLDFASEPNIFLKHNIEVRPQVYMMEISNCSFSGCSGSRSANINLNEGSSNQVSEISIKNCVFRGLTYDNRKWLSESAIIGGKANTKDFYIEKCSFLGYTDAAINIEISDVIRVTDCTFAHNGIDIRCRLCNLTASSNYSEHSESFFESSASNNLSFTMLISNYFDGRFDQDYVIRDGAGSLVLINNNFGGSGGVDSTNLIKWDSRNISSIYSLGNFFRNDTLIRDPFVLIGEHPLNRQLIQTLFDKIGEDGTSSYKLYK